MPATGLTMNIGLQLPYDPALTQAAAQAKQQALLEKAPAAQTIAEMAIDATVTDNLTISSAATDAFAALLQQATTTATSAGTNSQAAATQTTATPTTNQTAVVNAANTTATAIQTTTQAPTPALNTSETLLKQATLTPLASQMATGTIQPTDIADRLQQDVVATSALTPTAAFGGNLASTPNPYTLIPGIQATASSAYQNNADFSQQLLMNANATGSLDLLI